MIRARESKKPMFDTSRGYTLKTCSKNDTFENNTINNAVIIIKNVEV